MEQKQQRVLDSLRRVQDFLDAHAGILGALRTSAGGKQLADAIVALTSHTDIQGATELALSGQMSHQRAVTSDLRESHMMPIATFARAKLRGVPDFAALTKSGAGLQPKPLVRAARAMATAAAPPADAFTAAGFPADTVQQLSAAADALDQAIVDRANAQVQRVAATKGISQELKNGREAMEMLNAVVSKQLVKNASLLAGWRAAKRVTAKMGAVRVVGGATAMTTASSVPSSSLPSKTEGSSNQAT